jgi:hypothetical protein
MVQEQGRARRSEEGELKGWWQPHWTGDRPVRVGGQSGESMDDLALHGFPPSAFLLLHPIGTVLSPLSTTVPDCAV